MLFRSNPHECPPIPSTPQTYSEGADLYFRGFVEREREGKRVVISALEVVVDYTDIDVSVASIPGEDMARAIANVTVEQIDGVKRVNNISGEALRILNWAQLGVGGVNEAADEGTGTGSAVKVSVLIPMEKPFMLRGEDYALPADSFKQIIVRCGANADIAVGGATLAINTAQVYVIAHCFLDSEVKLYAQDVWEETLFQTTYNCQASIGGRLQDAYLYKSATTLASLANVTSVNIPTQSIMPIDLNFRPDLVQSFLRSRGDVANSSTQGTAKTSNPFASDNDKVLPILWHTPRTRAYHGRQLGTVDIRTTHASDVTSLRLLTRTCKPRTAALENTIAKAYGIPRNAWRVNTARGTKRDPKRWDPRHLAYMPLKGTNANAQLSR